MAGAGFVPVSIHLLLNAVNFYRPFTTGLAGVNSVEMCLKVPISDKEFNPADLYSFVIMLVANIAEAICFMIIFAKRQLIFSSPI